MNGHIRAWRFAFEPVNALERAGGPVVSARGRIELVSDSDTVRQAILLLIGTRPGERVMRPDYGCHLFRLAFAPNDETTAGLAIHYVRVALERWEPRITVLALDARRHREQAGRLDIHLQYRLRRHPGAEQLSLSYDLHAGSIV
jgi:phage baseplate assembly protein W